MVESKRIAGYPDYEVTSDGKIISHKFGKRRELKPHTVGAGYLRISLLKNGKRTSMRVSRLVAAAFIGSVKELTVNHKDCDKSNNSVDNLEIISQLENVEHAFRMGVHSHPKKPVKQVDQSGQVVGMYKSMREAAIKTEIFPISISRCVRGIAKLAGGFRWETI